MVTHFSLFFSYLFLSGHTCQIFVGGKSHEPDAPRFVFQFTFSDGKPKILNFDSQNIYSWCPWSRQPRQISLHSCVSHLRSWRLLSHTHRQTQYIHADGGLLTNTELEPVENLLGDLNWRWRKQFLSSETYLWPKYYYNKNMNAVEIVLYLVVCVVQYVYEHDRISDW